MSNQKTKNDIEWENIFEEHNIIEKIKEFGSFEILAEEINKFREARLMTKFDHASQLPKIFKNNNLSILPISRGKYIIGKFKTFQKFNSELDKDDLIKIPPRNDLESLDYENITSEANAINCAFVSGILENFIGESELFPTVSGRMSSKNIYFKIETVDNNLFQIDVNNSQIEIDGGYEGKNALVLIEAKNYIAEDFIIRQLYYPYKLWKNKITKNIRLIFLNYSNGEFYLREYDFKDKDNYNSIFLLKEKRYIIQTEDLNIEYLENQLKNLKVLREPKEPFPQADDFKRIINLCELLKVNNLTKEDIGLNYDITPRQINYYLSSGKYLGLIGKCDNHYTLTKLGEKIFSKNIFDRKKLLIETIISYPIFNITLKESMEIGERV